MPRTADQGPRYKERADELIKQGMKKQEAFRTVAVEELGDGASEDDISKKQKSVASTYYRLNRELSGNGVPKTESKSKPKPKADKKQEEKPAPPPSPAAEIYPGNSPTSESVTTTAPAAKVVYGQPGVLGDIDSTIRDLRDAADDLEAARGRVAQLLETQSKVKELLG